MAKKRKKLHQILANKSSRKAPIVPKQLLNRPWIPSPYIHDGKIENEKHYKYKIYLGETLRDNCPDFAIDYEFEGLPYFFHARYSKNLKYTPDIFVEWHDDFNRVSYFADIEINGGIHYKGTDQILKTKERKDLIYPFLRLLKAKGKDDYKTVGSYIVIDVDDFEYSLINDIFKQVKAEILQGGVFPQNIDSMLMNMLKVSKHY